MTAKVELVHIRIGRGLITLNLPHCSERRIEQASLVPSFEGYGSVRTCHVTLLCLSRYRGRKGQNAKVFLHFP